MCHALPAKVIQVLPGDRARVDLAGVAKEISIGLIEDVAVGDWVVIHVGYALAKLDAGEAERTLAALAEIGDAAAADGLERAP